MNALPAANRAIALDPSALFWARIDRPEGCAQSAPGDVVNVALADLDAALALCLPVPIESVQAVFVSLGPKDILAIAAPRARLDSLAESGATVAYPSGWPDWIAAEQRAVLRPVNLLVGRCTPPVTLAQRRKTWAAIMASLVLAGVLALAGLERRIAVQRADQQRAIQRIDAALQDVDIAGTDHSARLARLAADVTNWEFLVSAQTTSSPPATEGLSVALRAWPRGKTPPALRLRSIASEPGSVSLVVMAGAPRDVQELAESLRRIKGWNLTDPPSPGPGGSSQSDGRVTLRLDHRADWSGAPAQ